MENDKEYVPANPIKQIENESKPQVQQTSLTTFKCPMDLIEGSETSSDLSSVADVGQCGLCGFMCTCFDYLSGPMWYLVWYCAIVFFQSLVVNGFVNSSISTLEKRYQLSSKESSLISSMYDIGCILFVIPVSYYGNKGHKPKWVGTGGVIMGIGFFIFAIPQLLGSKYEFAENLDKEVIMCSNSSTNIQVCDNTEFLSYLPNFKYIFYFGQFCIGMGASPLYTLGIAYIEENNPRHTTGLHVGISVAVSAIGPAVGYLIQGMLLKIYVDIKIPTKYLSIDTEGWVGAWWIGFVLAGILLLIISLPMIKFPEMIPETGSNVSAKDFRNEMSMADFNNIFQIMKSITMNLTYVCVSISVTLTMLSLSAISTYGPKYFQSIFDITSSAATITVGWISVPSLATGALIGGLFLSKFGWGLSGTLMFMALTSLISAPFSIAFLIRCGESKMAGVNKPYFNVSEKSYPLNLVAPCNSKCNCSSNYNSFRPLCDANRTTYFSPCFAGCNESKTIGDVTTFSSCNCINPEYPKNQITINNCERKICFSYYINVCLLGIMLFCTYLKGAPSVTTTMRSVRRHEVTIALGFQNILYRVLGSIPGPILLGIIIDRTCILWLKECNKVGYCFKYDIIFLSYAFFLSMLVINSLITVSLFIPRIVVSLNSYRNEKKFNANT